MYIALAAIAGALVGLFIGYMMYKPKAPTAPAIVTPTPTVTA